LISEKEGERRGIIADIIESNYLYALENTNFNIDAARIGSLMKLINNSFHDMINCTVRYTRVRGEIRIALYAKRQIKNGEELFFDYGYPVEKQVQISWIKAFREKYLFSKLEEP